MLQIQIKFPKVKGYIDLGEQLHGPTKYRGKDTKVIDYDELMSMALPERKRLMYTEEVKNLNEDTTFIEIVLALSRFFYQVCPEAVDFICKNMEPKDLLLNGLWVHPSDPSLNVKIPFTSSALGGHAFKNANKKARGACKYHVDDYTSPNIVLQLGTDVKGGVTRLHNYGSTIKPSTTPGGANKLLKVKRKDGVKGYDIVFENGNIAFANYMSLVHEVPWYEGCRYMFALYTDRRMVETRMATRKLDNTYTIEDYNANMKKWADIMSLFGRLSEVNRV